MPDFFHGKPLPRSDYPPDTEEKKKNVAAFFGGPAAPPKNVEKVLEMVKAIGEKHSGIKKWGSLGMCWGGKVSSFFPQPPPIRKLAADNTSQIVSLTAQANTPFSAVAEVHPAMVDANDAKGIKVPLCMLASKDEDPEAVKKFGEALTVKSHIETFDDQVHGWMAAR